MKRYVSLILCVMLLLQLTLGAAGVQAEAAPVIALENVTADPGQEITMAVTIENNPGFSYLEMTPVIPEGLTLVSVENGDLISDFTTDKQCVWSADEDITANGLLMTFTFMVNENAQIGNYEVSFVIRFCGNYNEEEVQFAVKPGKVTVGDVNAAIAYEYEENGEAKTAYYASMVEAMAAATSGTVKLLADATAGSVILQPGVTLDLNGHTLTADLVAIMKGANLTDGANCTGGGVLKVEKRKLVYARENADGIIPVWNGEDGYLFTKVTFQQLSRTAGEDAAQYIFLPTFTNKQAAALLADGGTDNGIKIKVCLTWAGGQTQQFYTYSDDLVQKVYDGTGKWVFDLKVTGIAGITDMVASPIVITDVQAQATTTGVALKAG